MYQQPQPFTTPEPSQKRQTAINPLIMPFTICQTNLTNAQPQTVNWLWQNRLPLTGITLLDGDHGSGKSILALQLAAAVSSGSPMPDGSPTIQGGVIIIAPNKDATTTQLQCLTAFGADLAHIEILTFIQEEPTPESQTPNYHPFSLPDDFTSLLAAVERINARLIILDPFINLLSRHNRWTNARLFHLLADLNQRLLERNIACLLIRNCPAKGGHARPSMLERSDYFLTTAVSRLLLAPDPFYLNRPLLSHASSDHVALASTLILQVQPHPDHPNLPHITSQETHSLKAQDFIANRPDVLHRRLLAQHLLSALTAANKVTHVSLLYSQSPHSSPFQVQRALNDLINMGQIERPARGFYALTPPNPIFQPSADDATTDFLVYDPDYEAALEESEYQRLRAIFAAQKAQREREAAIANSTEPVLSPMWRAWMRIYQEDEAAEAAKALPTISPNQPDPSSPPPPDPDSSPKLNSPAATTSPPDSPPQLNSPAATTTPDPDSPPQLNSPAATTTPDPDSLPKLNSPAATTPHPEPDPQPNPPGTRNFSMTPEEAHAYFQRKVSLEEYRASRRRFTPPPEDWYPLW